MTHLKLNADGLTPGGSSTVHTHTHTHTQTIHRTTQLIWEECGPCHVFASYILAIALQLRKKHGKPSVRVAEECQLARWKRNVQNRAYRTLRIHKRNNKNPYFTKLKRDRGSTVVKVLCFKSERPWFDPSWCQWNFSLTQNPSDRTMTLGSTQPLTEMSTGSISWG